MAMLGLGPLAACRTKPAERATFESHAPEHRYALRIMSFNLRLDLALRQSHLFRPASAVFEDFALALRISYPDVMLPLVRGDL